MPRLTNIFIEHSFNQQLEENGFVKIAIFNKEELSLVKNSSINFIKNSKSILSKSELSNYINHPIYRFKKESNELVDLLLCQKIKPYLDVEKVEVLPVSHIIKPFGKRSSIWHQDSAIVDERQDISLNAWMPISNSTILNGCLWVIPGSHRLKNFKRQFGWNPVTTEFHHSIKKSFVPVFLKKGEVLFFHRNMIHGSSANLLPFPRIALEGIIVNKGAQFMNFHRDNILYDNQIIGYKVSPSHFLKENPKEDFYSGELEFELFPNESINQIQDYLRKEISQGFKHD
jgi:hypothetical protein